MKYRLLASVFFILIAATAVSLDAQIVQPQQNPVIPPIGSNSVQGTLAPSIPAMTNPVSPQGGVILAQQPSVIATPFQTLGNVNFSAPFPNQVILAPAGSIFTQSLPGFTPSPFIATPISPILAQPIVPISTTPPIGILPGR
jgi:hypothetical protein